MGEVKFVERVTFRTVVGLVDDTALDVRIGMVFTRGAAGWRVAGIAANPNRPGDRLVFVERVPAAQAV